MQGQAVLVPFPDQGGLDGVLYMGWGSGTANMAYLITVRISTFES